LQRHLKYECGKEPQFQCPHCTYRNTVLADRRYSCDRCSKNYQRESCLLRHKKYECGKEPQFQCSYCPHRTKRKESLRAHLISSFIDVSVAETNPTFISGGKDANGPRTFYCSKCGKTYKLEGSLKRHKKYECGKEPQFMCSMCPFMTKRKEALRMHIVYKHEPNPTMFRCHLCQYASKRKQQLNLHYYFHHSNNR
ncbi:hypothetical protein AAG570_013973, partial [Ranatra chinensis]